MASAATAARGWRRWARPVHSVRVRITLAAVLVTVVAVVMAGWLLVRSVEDTQLAQVRDDVNDSLDQVATRLEEGADPQEAVEATSSAGSGCCR
jgi:Flp pilus assembly protein TadB